jgi:hypothetical protein
VHSLVGALCPFVAAQANSHDCRARQAQRDAQSAHEWDADERDAPCRNGEGERDGQKAEGAPKATKANPFVAAGMERFVGQNCASVVCRPCWCEMTEEQRMTKARALAQAAWFVHEALERLVDAEARPDLWQTLNAVLDAIADDPDAYLALVNAPPDGD